MVGAVVRDVVRDVIADVEELVDGSVVCDTAWHSSSLDRQYPPSL